MKTSVVIFCSIVACVWGSPAGYTHAVALAPIVPVAGPVEITSQYHSQDDLGHYTYGYSAGTSAKTEAKTIDGITRGSYAYVDGNGVLQSVHYSADAVNGFRVAGTNIPIAPAAEKVELPKPVDYTPEVVKARAEHLAAIEEAKSKPNEVHPISNHVVTASSHIRTIPIAPIHIPSPLSFSYTYLTPTLPHSFAVAPAYSAYSHVSPIAYTFGPLPVEHQSAEQHYIKAQEPSASHEENQEKAQEQNH